MENADKVSTTIEAAEAPSVETPASPEVWVDSYTPEEIEAPEEEGSDTYISTSPPVEPRAQKRARAIDAALAAANNGEEIIPAYNLAYLSERSSISAQKGENIQKSLSRPFEVTGEAAPEVIAAEVANRKKNSDAPILGEYMAWVESQKGAPLLSQKEKEYAALQAWYQNTLAKISDETTIGGLVGDVAQMMFATDNNFRIADVAEYLGMPVDAGDYIDNTELHLKMANAFSQISPEHKAALLNDVVSNWETFGLFDNKIELMSFLGRMMSMKDSDIEMLHVENVLDRADQAMVGKLVGGKIWGAIGKTCSVLRRTAALKTVDTLRDVAKAGAAGALKEAGVDTMDAANTLLPMSNVQKLTQGAPPKMAKEILDVDTELAKIEEEFADGLGLKLSIPEKERKIEKAVEQARLEPNVTDVYARNIDDGGFELVIETSASKGGESITGVRPIRFTRNDAGAWVEEQQVARSGENIWSPQHRLEAISDDIVNNPYQGLLQGARFRKAVDTVVRTVLKPLKKASMRKVDELLLKGDGVGTFSYTEAVELGIDGVKYTDKEYRAYSGMRQVFDTMYNMMNKQIQDLMAVRGIKKVVIDDVDVAGKVYDDVGTAKNAIHSSKHSPKFLHEGKVSMEDLTPELIDDMYGKGYRLVRPDKGEFFDLGKVDTAEWAFVKMDAISEPTGFILNKVPGYVSKMRKGANFFLKKHRKYNVGGKPVSRWVTERYSDNYSDLEKFRKSLPNAEDYTVLSDRAMSAGEKADEFVAIQGGLFKGSRKSTIIPFGTGEVEGARKSALTSLQAYINNIAQSMPIAVYREGLKQRWINSAKEANVLVGDVSKESFEKLIHSLKPDHPKSKFFKQSHNEISFINGVRTASETAWETTMTKLGRYAETKPFIGKPLGKILYSDTIQDLPATLKTLTYHTMLGSYSPAQLFIQASGALLAFTANPVHSLKGFSHSLDFTILDVLRNKKNIEVMGKHFDLDAWKLWDKSGMREGITSTHLDYSNKFNDAPYDAGFFGKALSNSDMFVKQGEMVYARIAFGTAYDYVKKQLGRVPTEKDLSAIIKRADAYRLNMHKANAAKFQKGLMGIPTQFMQVQTKFIEKFMGKQFTAAEKTRIFFGQAAAYGAAGVPLVGTMYHPILDFLGIEAGKTDPEKMALYQRGVIGYLLTDVMGTNAEFSGRLSLGQDIGERLMKLVMAPALPNAWELATGPSFSIFDKSGDFVQRMAMITRLSFNADSFTDKDILAATQVIAEEAMQLTATTRNAMKGYVMATSQMYHNKQGLPIFHYKDPSITASIAQALGFQNREVTDWYDIGGKGSFLEERASQDSLSKMMASTMVKMINAGADKQSIYGAAYNALLTSALSEPGGEKVLEQMNKLLATPGTTWHDQMVKGLAIHQTRYHEGLEELMKQAKVRTNVTLAREMKKFGVGYEDEQ